MIQVCKKSFGEIHGIGKRRIELLCCKLASGVLLCEDQRGKHTSRLHATSEEVKTKIFHLFLVGKAITLVLVIEIEKVLVRGIVYCSNV